MKYGSTIVSVKMLTKGKNCQQASNPKNSPTLFHLGICA